MTRQLRLNAFLMSTGHHEASWRLPESNPTSNTDVAHYVRLAQTAERGQLDSVFFADSPALLSDVGRRPAGSLEPTVLLTAMAMATSRVGLIGTASTSYNDPYNLARRFASLDHISGGRAGWNIVTTATLDAARNFGLDEQPAHADRYRRADEFVDVAIKLWDSWDDDAVLADKEAGVWGDNDRVHPVGHVGTHFRVAGALNLPRSPQGRPVLVQAGSSEDGRDFAARHAEAIFTAQQTLADGQEFYADIKARAASFGRDPDQLLVLPGIVPAIGSTEAEARELEQELDRLIRPEFARTQLARTLRVAPERLALDRQLPARPARRGRDRGCEVALHADRQPRPTRAAHRARAHRPARRRPRAPHVQRHARAGRRRHRGVVRQWRGRRLQHHAAGAAERSRGVRRPRRPDPAGARPVPRRRTRARRFASTMDSNARSVSTPTPPSRRRPHDHRDLAHAGHDRSPRQPTDPGRDDVRRRGATPTTTSRIRIIHRALDAGINVIDTADVYARGESEEIVGSALKGRRDDVVLATKFHGSMSDDDPNQSGNSRRWIVREVENSLRRLQTDHIDLYQVHRPRPETDIDETLVGALRPRAPGQDPLHRHVDLRAVADRRGAVGGRAPPSRASRHRAAAVLHPRPRGRAGRAADGPQVRPRRPAVEPARGWLALGSLPPRRGARDIQPPAATAGPARPVVAGERRASWRRSTSFRTSPTRPGCR